jgi:hypothetical protein
VIDNPERTERLLARLQAALPVPTRLTPELVASLREQKPPVGVRPFCEITWILRR